MLKHFLRTHKIWKKSYQLLTILMVAIALFLMLLQWQMTNVQGKEKEAVPIPERRTAGKPNTECVEEIHRLASKQKKQSEKRKNQKKLASTKEVISEKEYEILTRIVEAETTGGDIKSKQIVANVILNRVKSEQFPNSIEGVVFQRTKSCTQFSPVADGRYYSVLVSKETKKAVKQALSGIDDSKGALYFANRTYSTKENMRWFDENLQYLFSYGGHEFFKEKP